MDIGAMKKGCGKEIKMATIKDIADKLGISVGTVSKGLNGASDISETLRQTVLDTAVARRTCGYIGSNFWNKGRTQEIVYLRGKYGL